MPQVAAWQLPLLQVAPSEYSVALPALQRGAVWKPMQIEALWDSILRGFPIGAFIVSPIDRDMGVRKLRFQEHDTSEATHHLLDGQQRSNAIALGFLDVWDAQYKEAPASLWVDLAAPPAGDERRFVIRVVTRSHPWGYRNDALGIKAPRLTAPQIREALAAYRFNDASIEQAVPSEILLRCTWPWEARAPVMRAAPKNVGAALTKRLAESLPYWRKTASVVSSAGPWIQKVQKILAGNDDQHFQRVLLALKRILNEAVQEPYRIPLLTLPLHTGDESSETSTEVEGEANIDEAQDGIQTLFIRINSEGTELEGEELIYSILKSIWPEAQDVVERTGIRFVRPSSMVVLVARLVLARGDRWIDRPPPELNVARFRRLIRGQDKDAPSFKTDMREFLLQGRATELFAAAREFLVGPTDGPVDGDFRFPPIVAAGIVENAPHAMFLFLSWLQRVTEEGKIDPATIDEERRRRTLGAVSALAWFSENPADSIVPLWKALRTFEDFKRLTNFFSAQRFPKCCERNPKGKFRLVPLPPPDLLGDAIASVTTSARGFGTATSEFWNGWSRWNQLQAASTKHEKLRRWYKKNFSPIWARVPEGNEQTGEDESLTAGGAIDEAWRFFINRAWGERRLLLYAQRGWLRTWFQGYDPTSPDQLEDTNRPYDFDHILASKYIDGRHNIPEIIKQWHGSIGNLRAWPLELNRSDAEDPPRMKIGNAFANAENYHLATVDQRMDASVLSKETWLYWEKSTPESERFPLGYLSKAEDYPDERKQFIRAVTSRFLALYRHWYESLRIGDLFG